MALDGIGGIDHVVILVRDLDAGASAWGRLGFTLSPRGRHSVHKGTANHTMVLGRDYLELLGILTETELNAGDRAALAEDGEGVDRAALLASDAAVGLAAIRAQGLEGTGPQAFGRPVTLPDGTVMEAAFRTFEWPAEAAPGGLRLFACEHLTPEAVWVPALQEHANTADAIIRLEILSADPEGDATQAARLTGSAAERCPDGAWRTPGLDGRADLVFLDPSLLAERHPGIPIVQCRASGAAALTLRVRDLAAAERSAPAAIRTKPSRLAVPPTAANGVLLVFEEA